MDQARQTANIRNIDRHDSLSFWINRCCDHEILSQDEQITLCKAAQAGDESAFDRLVLHNMRLVVSVAKRYKGKGLPFPDLVSGGTIGLCRSVNKYDPTRGTAFSTCATIWIRQAISRAVSSKTRNIRLPVYMHDRIRRIKRKMDNRSRDNGETPDPMDLLEEEPGDCPEEPFQHAWFADAAPVRLDAPFYGDTEDGETVADMIPGNGNQDPVKAANETLLSEALRECLAALPFRQRQVIRWRMGLYDGEPLMLAEIGERLGVTQERARQIEKMAFHKLRHPKYLRILRPYTNGSRDVL